MPPGTTVPLTIARSPMPGQPARAQTDAEASYDQWLRGLAASRYMDYPLLVGIETLARCNATCDFCPYPTMDRQGERMSDRLIDKLLGELARFPPTHRYNLNLTRVNEPFLDKRLVDIMLRVEHELPGAGMSIYTNGSALTDRTLDRLERVHRVETFNVSLNSHEPGEYKRIMGLEFERTVANIDSLYARWLDGRLTFPINVSRVRDGTIRDEQFDDWVQVRWPKMRTARPERMDWIGATTLAPTNQIPRLMCVQWFGVHLLASGKQTHCVIDHAARFSVGDAHEMSLLELYNHPARRAYRQNLLDRSQIEVCRNCTYWG